MAQSEPLDSSGQKNWHGGQRDQGHGVALHVQEEVYQSTLTFRRRVAKYQEWCLDPSSQKFWFVSPTHPSSVLNEPNQGKNTSPCWTPGLVKVLFPSFFRGYADLMERVITWLYTGLQVTVEYF